MDGEGAGGQHLLVVVVVQAVCCCQGKSVSNLWENNTKIEKIFCKKCTYDYSTALAVYVFNINVLVS